MYFALKMDDISNHSVLCFYIKHTENIECNGSIYHNIDHGSGKITPTDGIFWGYILIYIFLVLFAGLMSGLTMGLLSLDILSLEVLKRSGKPKEQKYASRIITLVKQHHLLLVTLLLANAVAVESMPIFLNKITNEIVAIVVSVTAVLLFGEIIPQALCTRFGLAVGYYCAPLVYLLMASFFVVAFPIAKFLDCVLGQEHGTFFRRAELRELVQIHGGRDKENEEPLSYDEVLIVKGALEMRDKTVRDAMTPLESVFMFNVNEKLGHVAMDTITIKGYSRIPVYQDHRKNIVGLLLVKKLITLDPDGNIPIKNLEGATIRPPSCSTNTPLFDILNQFQTGRSHLYLVYEDCGVYEPDLVGIITLEDVIEELIGEEIVDETDLYIDVHRRISVARARVQLHRQQTIEEAGSQPRMSRSFTWTERSQSHPANMAKKQLLQIQIPHVPTLPVIPSSAPEYDNYLDEDTPLLMVNHS